MEVAPVDSKQIAALVKKYEGIPYRHAGRDLTGLDCLGLAHYFYKDCGIDIPANDGQEYPRNWAKLDPERYLRGILQIGQTAPLDDLAALDFVYFRIGRYISHGGVMVDPQQFIHVLQNTPVHVSLLNSIWKRRLVGARRLV
jgi:cell wall-associated NlpC family hydrolase